MKIRGKWLLLAVCILAVLGFGAYLFVTDRAADHQAPEISFQSEILEVSIQDDGAALLAGVSAWDQQDGDVTDSVVLERISSISEEDTVAATYAAFDRAGNVTKAQRTLRYTDYRSPKFSLSGPMVFRGGLGQDLFNVIHADDVVDGNLSNRIKASVVSDSASVAKNGYYEVEFRVTNSLGDTSYLTVPVDVFSSSTYPYNASLTLSKYMVYVKKGSSFVPEDYLRMLTTSYEEISLAELPDKVEVTVNSDVNTRKPGTYSVTYTAEYRTYIGYTRLIVVVEE